MSSKNHTANGWVAREQRQKDAAARQKERAERSNKQQLALIAKRPGSSTSEVRRLKRKSS